MNLAERMGKRLVRGIKDPIHSLVEENEDYIIFNYPNYYDDGHHDKDIIRESKILYKAAKELKRFRGKLKYVWINDYVLDLDKI